MIVRSLCNTCFQTYILLFQAGDVDLIKQISDKSGHTCPCPRLCGGRINLIGEMQITEMCEKKRLREPLKLTGKELFRAVNGLGLSDEIPTSMEMTQLVLKDRKIDTWMIEERDGNLYLHELHLDNGIIVHLTAGSRGAQILKLTKGFDGTSDNR